MIKYVDLGISEDEYDKKISPLLKEIFLSGQFVYEKQVQEFENNFASYCGSKYAVALNSGTDALIFALKSLGIGQDDEVITVSNSFIATANAISYVGAKAIFVDIKDDLLIDSSKIEAAITSKTKAIIPVHLMGLICDMNKILDIAKKNNLFVIEDAAQSVGSKYNGKMSGTMSDIGCFSLHPLKNLSGVTDGGIVTTDNKEIATYIRQVRNHGLIDRDNQNIVGRVSRLNSINAAILNYRLTKLDAIINRRRKMATLYDEQLKDISHISLIEVSSNNYHTYHTYIIKVTHRTDLQKYLLDNGIETKIHYPVLIHKQKPYFNANEHLENTQTLSEKTLTLPVANVDEAEVIYICKTISDFYKTF